MPWWPFSRREAGGRGVVLDTNAGVVVTGMVQGDVVVHAGGKTRMEAAGLPFQALRPGADCTPSRLLTWRSRLSPLTGRDAALDDLVAWATLAGPRLRLVHGPSGVGKTRLGGELALALSQRGLGAGKVVWERPTAVALGPNGALLLADYPEEHPEPLERLLAALADTDQPVKVLLLSRQGPEHWDPLVGGAHAHHRLDPPLALEPLTGADPAAVARAGWTRTRALCPGCRGERPGEEALAAWLGRDPLHRRPLLALAYGVHCALAADDAGDGAGAGRELTGAEVLNELARREAERLRGQALAGGLDREAALRLTAVAAAVGDLGREALTTLAGQPGLHLPAVPDLADGLHRAGFLADGVLPAPQPDLLAPHVLPGTEYADLLELIERRLAAWGEGGRGAAEPR